MQHMTGKPRHLTTSVGYLLKARAGGGVGGVTTGSGHVWKTSHQHGIPANKRCGNVRGPARGEAEQEGSCTASVNGATAHLHQYIVNT